jgi:hypothetical protein
MDIFEQASRQNLTFTTERGTVGFSDLWKFSKGQLNTLYVDLKKVADSTTSGLISTNTTLSNKTKLQMAIVEHIFKSKVEEEDIAKKRAEAKDKLAILARAQEAKTVAAIEAMSPEQIEAEIAKLQAQL